MSRVHRVIWADEKDQNNKQSSSKCAQRALGYCNEGTGSSFTVQKPKESKLFNGLPKLTSSVMKKKCDKNNKRISGPI